MKEVYDVTAPSPEEYTEEILIEIRKEMYRKITEAFASGWYRGLLDAPDEDDADASSSLYPRGGKQEHKMSVLQNLKNPVRLQCKRCGREWLYHGKNPYRARCTFCGTTVMIGSSRVDN